MKRCICRGLLGAISVCGSLAWAQEASAPAKPPYDLYLLIGQSNMAGRGAVDAESKQVHPRVDMLNKEGQWVPATDPLHFDKPTMVGVGPGLAFGKSLAEAAPQARIGLIPCAVGGTSITVWEPGKLDAATKTHPYDDMLQRARLALKDGKLKGIVWHQGEADRGALAKRPYDKLLLALIARLRADLAAPDVPFVAGEMPDLRDDQREVNAQFNTVLRSLVPQVPNYAVAAAANLHDRGDKLHLDAPSARILGQRYAEAMLAVQKSAARQP